MHAASSVSRGYYIQQTGEKLPPDASVQLCYFILAQPQAALTQTEWKVISERLRLFFKKHAINDDTHFKEALKCRWNMDSPLYLLNINQFHLLEVFAVSFELIFTFENYIALVLAKVFVNQITLK